MSEKVDVVFTRPHAMYGAGERAGFAAVYANDLMSRGIARKAPDREPEHVRVAKAKAKERTQPAKVEVVFLQRHRMYQPGEVAGFGYEYATGLVDGKIAAYKDVKEADVHADVDAGGDDKIPDGGPPPPPWGDDQPSKGQFVAFYKGTLRKDAISAKADELGLDLDESMTKAEMLGEIYDMQIGDGDAKDDDPVG
jgi:hypothetical protein